MRDTELKGRAMPENPTEDDNVLVDPTGQPLTTQTEETEMSEWTDADEAEDRRQASIKRQLQRRAATNGAVLDDPIPTVAGYTFVEEDEPVEKIRAAYTTGDKFVTKQPDTDPPAAPLLRLLWRALTFNIRAGQFWLQLIHALIRPPKPSVNDDI